MNFGNILSGVGSFISNIFRPKEQPLLSPLAPTQPTSPLPDLSRGNKFFSYVPSTTVATTPKRTTTPTTVQNTPSPIDQGIATVETTPDIVSAFVDPIAEAIEKWRQRLEEFDKNNPFAFDEAQARASSEERLNPFYDAELNDFLQGIRYSRTRSFEDMNRTIGELNVDASKLSEKERFATQEAIRSSEEGFAGAGLFFSGARERATGVQEVGGIQREEELQTNLERGIGSAQRSRQRLLEDTALQEARQRRLIEAGRTTALETDISAKKKEAEYRRGLERLQFAGDIPGISPFDRLALENQFYQNIG